jgi:hypothetical protein
LVVDAKVWIMITAAAVLRRVEEIRRRRGDPEVAHTMEDELRADVLAAIADGAENPRELASAALETSKIEFARWCA